MEQKLSKEEINNIFPEESYTRAIELIDRIKKLVPINKDKVTYLETLISYVDGLINGDSIHQYITYEYISKYAKEALKEIMDETHEQILESYRLERTNLQSEVSRLNTERQTLEGQVESLQKDKDNLTQQTNSLSIELKNLMSELEEIRTSGLSNVHKEIDDEREKLSSEVEVLTQTKTELSQSIYNYNLTISRLLESKDDPEEKDVIWETLKEDDPILEIIYEANYNNIAAFIKSLKEEYINNTGVNEQTCDEEFNKNTNLSLISTLMQKLINNPYASLLYILNYKDYNSSEKYDVIRLKKAIKDLKIPVYLKDKKRVTPSNFNINTMPTDISTIKRELYFQKIAMESLTEKRIIESQFQSLLEAISTSLPEEYVKTIMESYNNLTSSYLTDGQETNQLKLTQ